MTNARYRELSAPISIGDDMHIPLMLDGLDAEWWMLDRVLFGSFVAVMADGGEAKAEIWEGLRAAWGSLVSADMAFIKMLSEGDEERTQELNEHINSYMGLIKGLSDVTGLIGRAVMPIYMAKIPIMLIEHMDAIVRLRMYASEIASDPCEEFVDSLLNMHCLKMRVMELKLDKTVFCLNGSFMRGVMRSAEQALPMFMGAMASGLSSREAMGQVANRFNLPVEML